MNGVARAEKGSISEGKKRENCPFFSAGPLSAGAVYRVKKKKSPMTPRGPSESFKHSEEAPFPLYLLLHQFATEETQDLDQSFQE